MATRVTKATDGNKQLELDFENLTMRDIRNNPLSKHEIRAAVELYYDFQDFRISAGNRKHATQRENIKNAEMQETSPVLLKYISERCSNTEKTMAKFLQQYAENDPVGKWLLSIPGIGGTLACGLLAYIDISKCKTAGAIWSYAGWTGPTQKRKRGEKFNHNPKFRVLCWKIGQQFIKLKNNPKDIYGHLYEEKKQFYIEKNESGGFADRAKEVLEQNNYGKDTKAYAAYSTGKLPDSHIHAMATRFAVKMFLSHLFTLWYEYENGVPAPKPFVEEHLGHVHIIAPPNREILFPNETK